jgi:P-type Cu2+ transporter
MNHHHDHHVAMFRRRFWWSLLLTVPIVATSHMVMGWLGYDLDFAGMGLVGPVLGTVLFVWGGWPFLSGGREEVRSRRPGMMLLIAMAISVAYGASLATSLGWITLAPAVGAVLMSASTIVVALNAQLLRRLDLRRPSTVGASA